MGRYHLFKISNDQLTNQEVRIVTGKHTDVKMVFF